MSDDDLRALDPPDEQQDPAGAVAAKRSGADDLLDELVPEDLDWRRLVVTYPKTSITLAAVGGYILGRSRGAAIITAVTAFAADALASNVNELLGEDVI